LGELEVVASERGVRLDVTAPGLDAVDIVDADDDLLERTLINLLENAVRHAPAGSTVNLTGRRREGGGIEIGVADAGKEIAPELRERLRREPPERTMRRLRIRARTPCSSFGGT